MNSAILFDTSASAVWSASSVGTDPAAALGFVIVADGLVEDDDEDEEDDDIDVDPCMVGSRARSLALSCGLESSDYSSIPADSCRNRRLW